jgi:DNA mismatch endonuclease (patch repair protein)
LHRRIVPGTRRSVDIAFGPARVAVDVRGCFWHGCRDHFRLPPTNGDWWLQKIEKNRARDNDTLSRLELCGWHVLIVWEHDDPVTAAASIALVVRSRRPGPPEGGSVAREKD